MPDSTALLQTLDTHFFASLKKNILMAKAQVHEQEEAAFRQLGINYKPQWGPQQLASVLALAWAQEQKRQEDHDWILQCGLQNQLWVWRPDAEGNTICVDDDPTLQDVPRMPPSKGIVSEWAQRRVQESPMRHHQAPVEPDFEDLNLDLIHIAEEPAEPDKDEVILDQRLAELELSPEQIQALKDPYAHLQLEVPDYLVPSAKSIAKRTKGKKHGKWSRKLEARNKLHARWESGEIDPLMLLPRAAKSKAFSQAKTGKFLSKVKSSMAKKGSKDQSKDGPSKDQSQDGPSKDAEPLHVKADVLVGK